MSDATDFEYFEGTQTIKHDDGSTTYITTYHEPYVEPLTGKQQVALLGVTVASVVGIIALPGIVVRVGEWADHRKEIRELKRLKKKNDLLNQSKTD
jgi:hypothetical protein